MLKINHVLMFVALTSFGAGVASATEPNPADAAAREVKGSVSTLISQSGNHPLVGGSARVVVGVPEIGKAVGLKIDSEVEAELGLAVDPSGAGKHQALGGVSLKLQSEKFEGFGKRANRIVGYVEPYRAGPFVSSEGVWVGDEIEIANGKVSVLVPILSANQDRLHSTTGVTTLLGIKATGEYQILDILKLKAALEVSAYLNGGSHAAMKVGAETRLGPKVALDLALIAESMSVKNTESGSTSVTPITAIATANVAF